MFEEYIRRFSRSRFWISKRDAPDLLGSRVSAGIVSPAPIQFERQAGQRPRLTYPPEIGESPMRKILAGFAGALVLAIVAFAPSSASAGWGWRGAGVSINIGPRYPYAYRPYGYRPYYRPYGYYGYRAYRPYRYGYRRPYVGRRYVYRGWPRW